MIVHSYDIAMAGTSEKKKTKIQTSKSSINTKKLELKIEKTPQKNNSNLINTYNNYNNIGGELSSTEKIDALHAQIKRELEKIVRQSWLKLLEKLFGKNSSEYNDAEKQLNFENSNFVSYQEVNIHYETTTIEKEKQSVEFRAVGDIITSDGRHIPLNIKISDYSESLKITKSSVDVTNIVKTVDPLVINIDDNLTGLSELTMNFDIDTDGKKEKIHIPKKGSGFLALDKNNDGKINDGCELFGTKSGDGFKDLAKYDDDHNGWIDEKDAVFRKLKVWAVSDDSVMKLIDLKKANVGAIFLGNVNTNFDIKNMSDEQTGILRKTGVYLREDGTSAGTISHVDLIA